MYNRYGERVREGIGWMGDLGSGNGSPGSLQGPEDSSGNTVPDYEPGNGQIVNDTSSGTSTGTGSSKGNNGVGNGDGGGKENNRGNGGKDKVSVLSVYSEPTTDLPVTTDDSASGASELDSLLTTTDEEPTADITTDLVKENPFRYAGYYWDRKTQYYYLQARYYDPRPARFISEDTYEGEIENPQSLNQYVYAENNPLNYTDPSGHMKAAALNSLAAAYSITKDSWYWTAEKVSATIITANGWGIYTALHEIAQVNIYKELKKKGYKPVLEQKIKSDEKTWYGKHKTYEADIVANGLLWEVKPLGGASAKPQIDKYTRLGGYVAAPTSIFKAPIKDIPVIKSIYMKIDFPAAGEARYSFYRKNVDDHGNKFETFVSTSAVKKAVKDAKMDEQFKKIFDFPAIPIPGLGPVLVPAI